MDFCASPPDGLAQDRCSVGMTSASAMDGNPKKAPEKVRLFEATQTTICERKEIFVAENENRDLNKPNQNQTGSNTGNPNNDHADQPQRAPRRRPMPRRNAARQTAEGEAQTANAAPRKPRMPRKPRAQQPQPVDQAADKPQEAAKPRRPRMPRKPMNQNPAPAANGEAQAAAQAPRAPKANTRTARPRATAAVGSTGNAPQIAAPQQAAKPMQPRRNPPRPRANSARPAERPQTACAAALSRRLRRRKSPASRRPCNGSVRSRRRCAPAPANIPAARLCA